jgi:hypothetical protein
MKREPSDEGEAYWDAVDDASPKYRPYKKRELV